MQQNLTTIKVPAGAASRMQAILAQAPKIEPTMDGRAAFPDYHPLIASFITNTVSDLDRHFLQPLATKNTEIAELEAKKEELEVKNKELRSQFDNLARTKQQEIIDIKARLARTEILLEQEKMALDRLMSVNSGLSGKLKRVIEACGSSEPDEEDEDTDAHSGKRRNPHRVARNG